MNDILNKLIPEENKDYKCYDLLIDKINNDDEFKNKIEKGLIENKILPFNTDFLEEIYNLNSDIFHISNYYDYFSKGFNIGGCYTLSIVMSILLKNSEQVTGINKFLIGTKNSKEGRHFWVVDNGVIYDTTFMLLIDEDYALNMGYKEDYRINLREKIEFLAKEKRSLDPSLRGKTR